MSFNCLGEQKQLKKEQKHGCNSLSCALLYFLYSYTKKCDGFHLNGKINTTMEQVFVTKQTGFVKVSQPPSILKFQLTIATHAVLADMPLFQLERPILLLTASDRKAYLKAIKSNDILRKLRPTNSSTS